MKDLLKRCRKGDKRAQFELFKVLYQPLMGICLRYESNNIDAEALLNEGFYKILSQLKKYDPHKPFEPWARRVQINTVLDHYRKNKKFKELITGDVEAEHIELDACALSEIEEHVELEFLLELMKKLPEATRAVFYLYAVDGLSYQQISEELKLSKGTIKWHIFKARESIRSAFSKWLHPSKQEVQ